MAELPSIKSSADKEDICSATHKCLAIYKHLETVLNSLYSEKDNEDNMLVLLNLSLFVIHDLRKTY